MGLQSTIARLATYIASTRAATARTSSSGKTTRFGKPLARTAVAVAVACNLLLVGTAAPTVADTVDDLNLGPEVIRTDVGPTGYSVTFRYDAPDDVESVRIWGMAVLQP